MAKNHLIISCEHLSNNIPAEYQYLFQSNPEVLETHRAYDLGTADLFNCFKNLEQIDFSISGNYSRLLIELNRSKHHPNLFSEFTKVLSPTEKNTIINHYYLPYRNEVESHIRHLLRTKANVYHVSLHSFTPILNGVKRNADVGFLYNPSNKLEKLFSARWKKKLVEHLPNFSVRYNYPYLGTADGFTSYLRKRFPQRYAGIELEVNNKWVEDKNWNFIQQALLSSLPQME